MGPRDDGERAAESIVAKPTYVEELERQLAEKDKLAQEYVAKYRQAASEFEESRLRLRREISKDIERARREVLADMLEVVDNLDRAIEARGEGSVRRSGTPGRRDGPAAVPVEARRAWRQPDRGRGSVVRSCMHEAISAVPAANPEDDGRVVGVVRHGYTIGDDVLRPAAVAVAKS